MSNRRMNLTGTGKELLDNLCDRLEVERPFGIKIALAKGIAHANGTVEVNVIENKAKWTIPDNIIRDKEYLLFKHLLINELTTPLNEEEVNQTMLTFIEYGLRIISNELSEISSIEDYRIKVLN
ncbi:hypothetical protein ACJ2A9_21900 [Anaerobacillus sp. MEB173]|uniref:hypothetical protein n=1 Tax=Anaerobacillus sp. MEB173 TaxID=3383345 RepID=UPI003F90A5F8